MAQPEPKRWGQAALGGLMVALGGALFGVSRKAAAGRGKAAAEAPAKNSAKSSAKTPAKRAKPGRKPSARAAASAPKVRTKPRPAEPAARTRYWPPPAPKPIAAAAAGDDAGPGSEPVDPRSAKLGYERTDAASGRIVTVMLVGVASIVGSIAVLFYLVGTLHRSDREGPPLTSQQLAVIVPPGPRLQDHPLHDIAVERQRESDLLNVYAWTDPQHRAARIPIARAQALVIGRPLDPPAAPPAAAVPAARP